MYNLTRKILPFYARKIEELLPFTTSKLKPEKFSGFIIFFSISLSIIISLLFKTRAGFFCLAIFFLSFFVLLVLFYFSFVLQANMKAAKIEAVLPDALQLMSSNLRAGVTTDRALFMSAREEFGLLKEEIEGAAREVSAGKNITEALSGLTKRIKSDTLERTIDLINLGVRSGGELASLLEEAAASIRQQMLVQKQTRTSVSMYSIFIFIAIAFVSPLLFALSSILVETLVEGLAEVEMPEEVVAMPFTISEIKVDPTFVLFFSILMLATTAILGSFVFSLITTGEERNGLRVMPLLLVLSIGVFFSVRILLSRVLFGFLI